MNCSALMRPVAWVFSKIIEMVMQQIKSIVLIHTNDVTTEYLWKSKRKIEIEVQFGMLSHWWIFYYH